MKKASKHPPAAEQRQRIEYMALGVLVKFPKNPKDHDLDELGAAFKDRGFVTPMLLDERSGQLVEGHGRLEKLQAMKDAGEKPPARIEAREDDWYVPVVRGVAFDGLAQARRHLLGANRIGEGLWDHQLLAHHLGLLGENFIGTGFGENDLAKFLTLSTNQKKDRDAVPDPPKVAVVKPGQLWQLGDHRLFCGDTTRSETLRALLGDDRVVLVSADPPYGMGKEADGVANDNLYDDKLDAFQMEWIVPWLATATESASLYVWGNAPDLWRLWWRHLVALERDGERERLCVRNEIVWDKGSGFGMSTEAGHCYTPATERCLFLMRGQQFLGNQNLADYWEGYEPLRAWLEAQREQAGLTNGDVNRVTGTQMAGHWFSKSQFMPISKEHYDKVQAAAAGRAFLEPYAELFDRLFPDAKKGGNAHRRSLSAKLRAERTYFNNTHDAMTDVWNFPRVTGEERFGHATPKPVSMIARVLSSSSRRGDLVAAPFAGTGPEFVAAEELGRRCVGAELDPTYCDTIIERWQQVSGKKAKLLKI